MRSSASPGPAEGSTAAPNGSSPAALVFDTPFSKTSQELIQFVTALRGLGYVAPPSLVVPVLPLTSRPEAHKSTSTFPASSSSETKARASPASSRPSPG
ncbi:hypothetical protein OH77DRAFT_1430924 [Trametes cingulata]|nr:hypothetical protein OH77DRAFT_1430924 [Trametes cingulata]